MDSHGHSSDPIARVEKYALVPVANSTASFLVVALLVLLVILQWLARLIAQWVALNLTSPSSVPRRLVQRLHNHPYLGDLLVALILYLPAVLVLSLCHNYDYDASINRLAWTGLAHLFVSTLLGTHFSPMAFLLPRSRLMLLHKWTSRLGSLFILAHMSIHLTNWIQWDFVAEQFQRSSMQFGLASFILLGVLVLTSLYPVRMLAYATFAGVHNLVVLMLSAFVFMHARDTLSLVLPMIAVFMLNKFLIAMQLVRPAHFVVSRVVDPPSNVKHPGGAVVRLEIAAPHLANVRPEQQVYIGAKPISTLHPFTPRAVSPTSLLACIHSGHPVHAAAPATPTANVHLTHRAAASSRPHMHLHSLTHQGSNTDLTSTASLASTASLTSSPVDTNPSTTLLLGTASADHPPTLTLLARHSPFAGFTTSKLCPTNAHRLVAFIPPAPRLPLPQFTSVVFIAGGIGITPVLAWLDHLAKLNVDGATRKRGSSSSRSMTLDRAEMQDGAGHEAARLMPEIVHVVWIVSREDELSMAPEIAAAEGAAVRAKVGGVQSVTVVVTGSKSARRDPVGEEGARARTHSGRPSVEELVPKMEDLKGPVMGFAVGPRSLVEDVRKLDRDWWLHVEPFTW
ncbi:hypothetical protein BCR44DRAFT_1442431 [Catenaria anguillulae PL171]|uniref:FAD-binding FR-type domain-containing protein n=1 Tax=Catenaria anguillulae PL171 TaxID=765915 RepID=A0A1Y2H9T8_9FUNG|nr:hypothetical protein BCR44DRAFT_1442431 [Catenaria anguillulae PL171]